MENFLVSNMCSIYLKDAGMLVLCNHMHFKMAVVESSKGRNSCFCDIPQKTLLVWFLHSHMISRSVWARLGASPLQGEGVNLPPHPQSGAALGV